MKQPRLRDSKDLIQDLYSLGQFPKDVINKIGASIVFIVHTGRKDMTGDDWGDTFAQAIGGTHLAKPVGIADVVYNQMAWSVKTVKNQKPFACKNVRLISGRCSPDYSFGIEDPHDDIQKTGEAVLAIWNSRVDIAVAHYPKVRVCVLVRNYSLDEFVLYEEFLEHYRISDFVWKENKENNLEGFHKQTNEKFFTWQPHGSQFTIHSTIPDDAVKFRVRRPPLITPEHALKSIGFDESWIEIVNE